MCGDTDTAPGQVVGTECSWGHVLRDACDFAGKRRGSSSKEWGPGGESEEMER